MLELTTSGIIHHLAGDHIFGLLPLMASLLNGAGGTTDGIEDPRLQVQFDKPASVSFSLLFHSVLHITLFMKCRFLKFMVL